MPGLCACRNGRSYLIVGVHCRARGFNAAKRDSRGLRQADASDGHDGSYCAAGWLEADNFGRDPELPVAGRAA